MTERPILFSAPMVRAILEGRKTQTRRVIKPIQPRADGRWPAGRDPVPDCRYGAVGDRLWVRETWAAVHFSTDVETGMCDDVHASHDIPPGAGNYWAPIYAADPGYESNADDRGWKWRPSIHMPRWASRITLEITGVRVERLQEIQHNEADALAEGAERARISDRAEFSACEDFKNIWRDINGAESWAANPWVWVVEFKRIEAARQQGAA